jgi:hypothetical protein
VKKRTLVGGAVLLALLAGVALGAELRVDYGGELIDGSARPLSGVFALRFKLYQSAGANDALWEEHHYVAVVDGEYEVALGSENPLAPELVDRELYVSVEFMDEELLREPLVLRRAAAAGQPLPLEGIITDPDGNLTQVTFAQLAERAVVADTAERAHDCERLGGLTAAELDRYDELSRRLAELEERMNRESRDPRETRGGGAQVGSSTTVLQRIGGDGGQRYTRMCPAGYVLVGARGGAAQLVDSIEFVCAPIE